MRPRRLILALAAVAAAAAAPSCTCSKESGKGAGAGTGTTAGAAAGTGTAAAPAAPPDPAGPPLLPPAAPAGPATDERCAAATTAVEPGLRELMLGYAVPNDQVDAATKALMTAFGEQCAAGDWPAALADCITRNPPDLFTFGRCIERLPYAARRAWEEKVAAVVADAGAPAATLPPIEEIEGTPFEELCAGFLAEISRLERCAGQSYSPSLEQVFAQRRAVERSGVIPTEDAPALKELCETRAESARKIASRMCPGERAAPSP